MLQTDIIALEHRQQFLEREISEALRHSELDELIIADLKARVLFLREEIDRLREQAHSLYH
jgi:hypothetical protein